MVGADEVAVLRTALRALVHGVESLRAHYADEFGVGTTDVSALAALHRLGAMAPRELGVELGLTSGSVTALCDRLVHAGLVAREQHPADRRRVVVTLTAKGRRGVVRMSRATDRYIGAALETAAGKCAADAINVQHIAQVMHMVGTQFSTRRVPR